MYLYNVSIIIEESINSEVKNWLHKQFIPSLPNESKFLSLIDSPHEGYTYCIQIHTTSKEEIEAFKGDQIISLQQYLTDNHVNKAFIFDSIMEYID